MYYVMRASAPSLHRESTDSLILHIESFLKIQLHLFVKKAAKYPTIFVHNDLFQEKRP